MWSVTGSPKEIDLFGSLEPVDVLGWYDGPRTFTLADKDGQLCLAHWLDEDRESMRFVVVPVSQQIVDRLQQGALTLREGLDQPRVYIADQDNAGTVRAVWLTRLADLPEDSVPVPGTMLHRELEPFFSLRATGEHIQSGEIPSSVIRFTVEAAQKSIKALAEYEMELPARQGRPSRALKRCYDLPAQMIRAASFQISFRSPLSEPDLFAGLSEPEKQDEVAVLAKVGKHLRAGLAWLTSTSGDNTALPVPNDVELSRIIIKSMKLLTPSPRGPIQSVELSGELLAQPTRPYRLSRNSRAVVNGAISRFPPVRETTVQLEGFVRELNADDFHFRLRDLTNETDPGRVCLFEPDLWDDVYDLLGVDMKVKVIGRTLSPNGVVHVIDLSLLPDSDDRAET